MTPPAPDDVVLPLPRQLTRADWLRRAAVWLAVLLAFLLLLRFDLVLMRWRFLLIPEEPSGFVRQLLFGLRDFGQPVPMIVAMVIVFLTDRRRRFFILTLLFAQFLGALLYNPVKWSVPRYRPHAVIAEVARPRVGPGEGAAMDGDTRDDPVYNPDYAKLLAALTPADTWVHAGEGPRPHATKYESFPSGHSGAAFAFAAVLACFYPHLRWLFWTLAFGCAASRYLDAVHWPSDCLAGAAIGYIAGWMALRPYAWVLPVILVRRQIRRRRAIHRRSTRLSA